MAVTAAAAIVGAGLGIYKAVKGASDKKKAAQAAARLRQPQFAVQDEYIQNKNIAEQQAGQGYTSAAKDYLTTESQRGLGTSINAITDNGGNPNDISKLYGVYQRSLSNTAAADSQQQIENIQRLMQVNKDIAGQKTMKWSLNEDRTYQNKLKEYKQTQMIADQNMWNGASEAVGSLGALGTSLSNSNLIPKNQGGAPVQRDFNIASAPAAIQTAQQPVQQTMQQRSSPSVDANNWEGEQDWRNIDFE